MRKYLVISNDLINIDKNKISAGNNDTINIVRITNSYKIKNY